jgi:hypothetical protein
MPGKTISVEKPTVSVWSLPGWECIAQLCHSNGWGFCYLGLAAYNCRTFFHHQNRFIFPAILSHWETYQAQLIQSAKFAKDLVWSGDGCFDSMGHSAKYGVYTMFCCTLMKIVHFDLLQASFSEI